MILARASRRYLMRHPWMLALSVIGVALGVAVVVAVDLANASARRAFLLSVQALSGRATHEIVGGPTGLDEDVYRRLRVEHGIRACAPVVEGYVRTLAPPGRTLQLLGIDPFAEERFRAFGYGGPEGAVIVRLLTEPGTALLTPQTARALGVAIGGRLPLRVGGERRELVLAGSINAPDPVAQQSLASVLVVDIATAQELLGLHGRLSRIELIVADDDAGLLHRVRAALPAGAEIVHAEARSHALDQMTRAFRVNLSALSLLALVVGMFLIYNIMTFSVVQRRALVATLRAIGASRRQVFAQVLLEAAAIGLVGTVLGVVVGIVLGKGLVQRVVQTINDLYFVLSVQELALAPASLAKGVALGVGASLLAALAPAWEATRAPVAQVLRRSTIEAHARRRAPRAALAGLALAALGAALLIAPGRSLLVSYAGLFLFIAGFALAVPLLTLSLMRLYERLIGNRLGPTARMAGRDVAAALSRTAVAVGALAVAVSATVGVGVMIDSFRQSFLEWLDGTLQADVYVSAPVIETQPSAATLAPALVRRLASVPGIAAVSTGRRVRLQGAAGITQLYVLDTDWDHFRRYRFKRGEPQAVWHTLQQDDAVMVSEPYAYRHRLVPGASVRLRTERGERDFAVAGIYYDYASDEGRVTMSRRTYERHWDDRALTSMAIYAEAGVDTDALGERLRTAAGSEQALIVRSNRALRRASVEIFDRTFAITGVLRALATIVAVIGVLSALMALALERARELAILRATGLTPSQLWALVTTETGLMGFIAGLLAVPLGVALALALILVINRRSFGWSLGVTIDPLILLQGAGLAVAAALLAGLYPAWRMARSTPAAALREE